MRGEGRRVVSWTALVAVQTRLAGCNVNQAAPTACPRRAVQDAWCRLDCLACRPCTPHLHPGQQLADGHQVRVVMVQGIGCSSDTEGRGGSASANMVQGTGCSIDTSGGGWQRLQWLGFNGLGRVGQKASTEESIQCGNAGEAQKGPPRAAAQRSIAQHSTAQQPAYPQSASRSSGGRGQSACTQRAPCKCMHMNGGARLGSLPPSSGSCLHVTMLRQGWLHMRHCQP